MRNNKQPKWFEIKKVSYYHLSSHPGEYQVSNKMELDAIVRLALRKYHQTNFQYKIWYNDRWLGTTYSHLIWIFNIYNLQSTRYLKLEICIFVSRIAISCSCRTLCIVRRQSVMDPMVSTIRYDFECMYIAQ